MGSSLCGAIMNRFVVLAACVCASTAQQVVVGGIAGAYNPAPSTQFHAQDEFGQFSFGHAGGPLARTEARNAYGVTTGSYQYVDANGLLQTVNYVADPVNGFRVAGTNLPVGPAVPAAAPLEAPVFDLPVPVAVEDTPEVAAAKAEFQAAFDEAAAASAERRKREAEEVAVAAAPAIAALPYPYAAGLNLAYAGLPVAAPGVLPAAAAVAHAPLVKSVVETPATVETEVAATPVISYAAAPAIAAPSSHLRCCPSYRCSSCHSSCCCCPSCCCRCCPIQRRCLDPNQAQPRTRHLLQS